MLAKSEWRIPARKAKAAKRGKLRGIGLSCYIEACGVAPLRPSAERSAAASACGKWPRSRSTRSAPSRSSSEPSVMARATRRPTRRSSPTASASRRVDLGDRRRYRQGPAGDGQLRLADGRKRNGAVSKALDKVEAKAKKIAAHLLEASETTSRSRTAISSSPGPTRSSPSRRWPWRPTTFHKLPTDLEPGLDEKAYFDPINLTYPAGAFVCEVEVDPATGTTEIVHFTAVDDSATSSIR